MSVSKKQLWSAFCSSILLVVGIELMILNMLNVGACSTVICFLKKIFGFTLGTWLIFSYTLFILSKCGDGRK